MKTMVWAVLLATLCTDCASFRDRFSSSGSSDVSASPATTDGDKVACAASGGKWNVYNRMCER